VRNAVKGLIVELTGGIGSGKTAAANMFAERGAVLVDADAIAHELTVPGGAAMQAIEAEFGREVIAGSGALDRAAMRRLAFGDVSARARLEKILHPMIRKESEARVAAALSSSSAYVVLVIPLLVESGQAGSRGGRTLVVDCPESLQVERVMARNGLKADEVKAIMKAQASRTARLAVADDVILNDKGLAELREQVAVLHVKYSTLADKIGNGG
jgi:dephospho-CoA kinase